MTCPAYGPTTTIAATGSGSSPRDCRLRASAAADSRPSSPGLTAPSVRTIGQPSIVHGVCSGASTRSAGWGRSIPSTTITPRGSTITASRGRGLPGGRQPNAVTPPSTEQPAPHAEMAARMSAPTRVGSAPSRISRMTASKIRRAPHARRGRLRPGRVGRSLTCSSRDVSRGGQALSRDSSFRPFEWYPPLVCCPLAGAFEGRGRPVTTPRNCDFPLFGAVGARHPRRRTACAGARSMATFWWRTSLFAMQNGAAPVDRQVREVVGEDVPRRTAEVSSEHPWQ